MLALLIGELSWLRLPGGRSVVSLYTSDVCVGHNPGEGHPEAPARLSSLLTALRSEWKPTYGEHLDVCEPRADVTEEQLLRVHTPRHVKQVGGALSRAQWLMGLR
jgi:acetoin utilization deacetylase AcuC-like enzyme